MTSPDSFKKLKSIVQELMVSLEGSAHAFDHVKRVYESATMLAQQEGGDLEVVQVGALLHDVGRVVGDPHAEQGVTLAQDVLEQVAYPPEKRASVLNIIAEHPLRGQPTTLEEKIIWDADKLDLIGIIGVARVFHWMGETHRSFAEALSYCLKHLPSIYPKFKTATANKIARKRHEELTALLMALQVELKGTDLMMPA